MGDDRVNHINRTPPRAGTRRGVASEPLCVPSERMRPEQATLVRRSGIINLKDGSLSTILSLESKVKLHLAKSLRRPPSSKEKKIAALFLSPPQEKPQAFRKNLYFIFV